MKGTDRVLIVGGGAAGMMAAISAADSGNKVCLIEKNEKLGKKLYITGKGRCNVTNAADVATHLNNVCTNSKFLYSAFYGFDNKAVMDFLEQAGCPLKIERGGRVFPVSDHSSDIIAVFLRELKKRGVDILLNTEVKSLVIKEDSSVIEGSGVKMCNVNDTHEGAGPRAHSVNDTHEVADSRAHSVNDTHKDTEPKNCVADGAEESNRSRERCRNSSGTGKRVVGVEIVGGKVVEADRVIVCTGGLSYPATGSTGDGYRLAESAGHKIQECSPALVPLEVKEGWCAELMGLSLRNVEIRLVLEKPEKRELYRGFGELLFTHFGVSGPLILSASSYYGGRREGQKSGAETKIYIDLKPAMNMEQLDKRLLRDFEENKNRQFKNALGALFPVKLVPVMVKLSGISPEKKANEVTREERKRFAELIKKLPLTVNGTRGFGEAVITRGGVSVKEIDPATMESKKAKGLYFAGEVLDLDALTGGFNLQIAWSTGYLAGKV